MSFFSSAMKANILIKLRLFPLTVYINVTIKYIFQPYQQTVTVPDGQLFLILIYTVF